MAPGYDSNHTSDDDNSIVELADGTTAGAGKPKQKVGSDNRAWTDAAVTASVLPTGAATAANQATEITALQLIDDVIATTGSAIPTKGAAVSGTDGTNARVIKTDSSGELQIDVLSSALPSGAATEASLAKLPVAQGSTTSGESGPLVQAAVTTAAPTYTTGQTSPLSLNTSGELRVSNTGVVIAAPNTKTTYSAFGNFNPASLGTTDVFTLTGSATKTIKIRQISIQGTNTGNTNALVTVIKRSTANSGGTSTSPSVVPHDSASAAGTGVARAYTANPTLGTLVGAITARVCFFPALASSNPESGELVEFSGLAEPITLRGTSEVVAVNLGAASLLSVTTLYISITWTEE